MKLDDLIKNLTEKRVIGDSFVEIKDIAADSGSVQNGSLFICLSGQTYDGHDFIKQVKNYGAVAIICEREFETPLTQVIVPDSRRAMSIVASEFYGHADKKMKIIGVVGTNGKTSTTHIIKKIFDGAGVKCGVIGTLGTFYDQEFFEPMLTTPDPIELHQTLFNMYKKGVKVVVMEVSAHAIKLGKVEDVDFEAGVFTNFSQDHLDFFHDMENYRKVKESFFDGRCKYVVVNSDDDVGLNILKVRSDGISYGIDNPSDVFAIDLEESVKGTSFVLNLFDCIFNVKLNLMGRFNVYNVLAALTVCALMGVEPETAVSSAENVKKISGRLEKISANGFSIFIDYAHTPDGLKQSITALKSVCKGRLICVFGCGGNRDCGKRKEMGIISGKYSDFTLITTDNPRYEDPMEIIAEIEEGVLYSGGKYVIVQDRKEGIEYALGMCKKDDVLLIAGKGSEKYQEVLGIKQVYNDKDTVYELLGRKKI